MINLKGSDLRSAKGQAASLEPLRSQGQADWVLQSLKLQHRQLQFREDRRDSIPDFVVELLLMDKSLLVDHLARIEGSSTTVVLFDFKGYVAIQVANVPPEEDWLGIPPRFGYLIVILRAFQQAQGRKELAYGSSFPDAELSRMLVPGMSLLLNLPDLDIQELVAFKEMSHYLLLRTRQDSDRLGLAPFKPYRLLDCGRGLFKLRSALPQAWAGPCNIDQGLAPDCDFSSEFTVRWEDVLGAIAEGVLFTSPTCSYYYFKETVRSKSCSFLHLASKGPFYFTVSHRAAECPFRVQLMRTQGRNQRLCKFKVGRGRRYTCSAAEGQYLLRVKAGWQGRDEQSYFVEIVGVKPMEIKLRSLKQEQKFKLYESVVQGLSDQRQQCVLCEDVTVSYLDLHRELGYFAIIVQVRQGGELAAALIVDRMALWDAGFQVKFPFKSKRAETKQLVEKHSLLLLRPRRGSTEVQFPPKTGVRYFLCRAQVTDLHADLVAASKQFMQAGRQQ